MNTIVYLFIYKKQFSPKMIYLLSNLLVWHFWQSRQQTVSSDKTQSTVTVESQLREESPHFLGPFLGPEWSYQLGKDIYLEVISSSKRLDYDILSQKALNTRKLRKIGTFITLFAIHYLNWTLLTSKLLWATIRSKMELKLWGKRLLVDNFVL